jgi:ferritin
MIHLKFLEKQEQTKPKTGRWREIIKISAKINEIKTKQTIQRINETESWIFENINKIVNKMRDEKGDITTNPVKS